VPVIRTAAPPYLQIAEAIREQITSGVLGPGDRVPGESELRETWGVSKATVRRAVTVLKSWGLVETRVGAGTRVVDDLERLTPGPGEHTDRM
jgi:DNA-binding GntR family transcriptional regulator